MGSDEPLRFANRESPVVLPLFSLIGLQVVRPHYSLKSFLSGQIVHLLVFSLIEDD